MKSSASKRQNLFFAGLVLIVLAFLCNHWVLTRIFSSDGHLEIDSKAKIWIFQIVLILTGLTFFGYRGLSSSSSAFRRFAEQHPDMLAASISLVLTTITLLLSEGVFYDLNRYKAAARPVVQEGPPEVRLHVSDVELGYKMLPNVQVPSFKKVNGQNGYSVVYSTDSYGRRIVPVSHPAQRTDFILFFGCSFMFGQGVNDDETLPYYVAQSAHELKPHNYALIAYGPQNMLAKLQSGELTKESVI